MEPRHHCGLSAHGGVNQTVHGEVLFSKSHNDGFFYAIPEDTMKPGNYWQFSQSHARREVNTPVILLIAGLGGFWITVAFLVFA